MQALLSLSFSHSACSSDDSCCSRLCELISCVDASSASCFRWANCACVIEGEVLAYNTVLTPKRTLILRISVSVVSSVL
jgi:hypothetical protein